MSKSNENWSHTMISAQDFLTEFAKDIVHHPMDRPKLIAGWAKHLEAREQEVSSEWYKELEVEVNKIYDDIVDPEDYVGVFDKILQAAQKIAGFQDVSDHYENNDSNIQAEHISPTLIVQDPDMPNGLEPFSDDRRKLKA